MNPFTTTLIVSPGFSRRLLHLSAAISILTAGMVITIPVNMFIKLFIIGVIALWLLMTLREHCAHHGEAITSAQLRADNSWEVVLGESAPVIAELLPGCLVQPWLTVLEFKLPDKRRKSLILLPDNISADIFRRIRVRLKFV